MSSCCCLLCFRVSSVFFSLCGATNVVDNERGSKLSSTYKLLYKVQTTHTNSHTHTHTQHQTTHTHTCTRANSVDGGCIAVQHTDTHTTEHAVYTNPTTTYGSSSLPPPQSRTHSPGCAWSHGVAL
eukprot:GHVQ01026568.1.p1 GENE.GHVQ01026568.1~~GHVQ01026568.1.p1  ORF type:complete len:143 (+),score=34.71 GHVQ01026568.1:53-430(+)